MNINGQIRTGVLLLRNGIHYKKKTNSCYIPDYRFSNTSFYFIFIIILFYGALSWFHIPFATGHRGLC
uniref:Uncharacterized protein n=1 Tax=Anguilla anguilla TaxID=7936 RepID=A0A0E9XNZ2_ANGAN